MNEAAGDHRGAGDGATGLVAPGKLGAVAEGSGGDPGEPRVAPVERPLSSGCLGGGLPLGFLGCAMCLRREDHREPDDRDP